MIEAIKKSLLDYKGCAEEQAYKQGILTLVSTHRGKCFYRDFFEPGHVTGSALLVSCDRQRVLMNHHKKLDKWICFGGHADGELDVLNVAKREVEEESGIKQIKALSDMIFDVDIHTIPETTKEPQHKHFDIRYIFAVTDEKYEAYHLSEESNQLKWCNYDEACALSDPDDVGMRRFLMKWREEFSEEVRFS